MAFQFSRLFQVNGYSKKLLKENLNVDQLNLICKIGMYSFGGMQSRKFRVAAIF